MSRGPGGPLTSPLSLSSVSDMEEPRCGELRCSGEADGEEWSLSGGKAGRTPPGSGPPSFLAPLSVPAPRTEGRKERSDF